METVLSPPRAGLPCRDVDRRPDLAEFERFDPEEGLLRTQRTGGLPGLDYGMGYDPGRAVVPRKSHPIAIQGRLRYGIAAAARIAAGSGLTESNNSAYRICENDIGGRKAGRSIYGRPCQAIAAGYHRLGIHGARA